LKDKIKIASKEILLLVILNYLFGEIIIDIILNAFNLNTLYLAKNETNLHSKSFVIISALVIAPFLEELIFRYPLRFFKTWLLPVLVSSTLFSLIHLYNYTIYNDKISLYLLLLAPYFLAGVSLSRIRLRYGIYYAVAMHFLYNLIVILVKGL